MKKHINEYGFTQLEYEFYCDDYLLDPESEVNYNRFRELVENGELIKCSNCEKWIDIDWISEYESDVVCEECMNDGFGL